MTPPRKSPGKRPTVIDVAQAAGVSPGTVSNALSGKRKVDADTRDRIEAAIQQLGYRPNQAARRMRTGQTNTIAIFSSMPFAVAAGPSKLGFLMEIAASAAVAAMARNTALILVPPIANPEETLDTIAMDGALVVEPAADDPVLSRLIRAGIPTVCIGRPPDAEIPHVDLDYPAIAELLIAHLFEVGATRFPLIVGASSRPSNLAFKAAYGAAARRRGMAEIMIEVPEDQAEAGAAAALSTLISRGEMFDGVLVPTDAMATGVMQALRDHGLTVPDKVRVVTRYDGVRAQTESPPLTAVDLKLEAVATLATRQLVETMAGPAPGAAIPGPEPRLVVRASSRQPRG
ncbi:LacI family DNA-binding transcriptional regulator [Dinoroseobacter sp. S375]|uniref:LacI family DNA-binding transcriptional regulator n=1 Tax=Dinoroseobacter sp. S375 TaxID=3415136 RepID=UPI003C7E8907